MHILCVATPRLYLSCMISRTISCAMRDAFAFSLLFHFSFLRCIIIIIIMYFVFCLYSVVFIAFILIELCVCRAVNIRLRSTYILVCMIEQSVCARARILFREIEFNTKSGNSSQFVTNSLLVCCFSSLLRWLVAVVVAVAVHFVFISFHFI